MNAQAIVDLILTLQKRPQKVKVSRQDRERFDREFLAEHACHSCRLAGINGLSLDEVKEIASQIDKVHG